MSLEINILTERSDAVSRIAGWYFEEWGYLHPDRTVEEIREFILGNLDADELPIFVVAARDGETVGVAQLVFREMDIYPDKDHWLGGVYVPSSERGNGVAEELIDRIVEIARSRGVDTLYLQTERPDGGLYRKLGWEILERTAYRGLQVTVMARDIR